MRTFDTGATRDTDEGKLDYEGFLSPLVLRRYAEYMHKHRIQADGNLRDSDNWQKGIPLEAYMSSMWRHFMDVWLLHRKYESDVSIQEALTSLMFNVHGYLHEVVKREEQPSQPGRDYIPRLPSEGGGFVPTTGKRAPDNGRFDVV